VYFSFLSVFSDVTATSPAGRLFPPPGETHKPHRDSHPPDRPRSIGFSVGPCREERERGGLIASIQAGLCLLRPGAVRPAGTPSAPRRFRVRLWRPA
jgi:hypothetical protein